MTNPKHNYPKQINTRTSNFAQDSIREWLKIKNTSLVSAHRHHGLVHNVSTPSKAHLHPQTALQQLHINFRRSLGFISPRNGRCRNNAGNEREAACLVNKNRSSRAGRNRRRACVVGQLIPAHVAARPPSPLLHTAQTSGAKQFCLRLFRYFAAFPRRGRLRWCTHQRPSKARGGIFALNYWCQRNGPQWRCAGTHAALHLACTRPETAHPRLRFSRRD